MYLIYFNILFIIYYLLLYIIITFQFNIHTIIIVSVVCRIGALSDISSKYLKLNHTVDSSRRLNSNSTASPELIGSHISNQNNLTLDDFKENHFGKQHSSSSTIFYEEDFFDDSVLAEIDAICESGVKPKAAVDELKSEYAITNGCEITTDVFFDGTGCRGLTEGMPDEYAKYMQSLNDRQREAACSDISIPLMIVAGPGSGKVVIFAFLFP